MPSLDLRPLIRRWKKQWPYHWGVSPPCPWKPDSTEFVGWDPIIAAKECIELTSPFWDIEEMLCTEAAEESTPILFERCSTWISSFCWSRIRSDESSDVFKASWSCFKLSYIALMRAYSGRPFRNSSFSWVSYSVDICDSQINGAVARGVLQSTCSTNLFASSLSLYAFVRSLVKTSTCCRK